VGIGEAAYATISPPMVTDFFPHIERNTAFGFYSVSADIFLVWVVVLSVVCYSQLCAPVGAAIGFGIGGMIGGSVGWREAFFVVGFPGVVLSLLALRMNDPVRGINDTDMYDMESEEDDSPRSPLRSPSSSSSNGAAEMTRRASHSPHDVTGPQSSSPMSRRMSGSPGSANGEAPAVGIVEALKLQIKEAVEIITNPYYFFSVGGLCANNFAIGEW
jgi:MFS family permease